MSKNLTQGNSLKLIVLFCIPVMLGLLLQNLYSILDSIIVGKYLGVNALAGIGATGSLSFLLTGFANGLTSGFALPISRSVGANDMKSLKVYVYNALCLCVVISTILIAVSVGLCKQILLLSDTPYNIMEYAYNYVVIIFAGLGFSIIYNMGATISRALGDSKTPLFFLAVSSVLNIILDIFFISKLHMDVEGAAIATIIAQAISGIACMIFLFKRYPFILPDKETLYFSHEKAMELLKIGIPMSLQFSITAIGNIILQSSINALGSSVVAAVSVAQKLQMIVVGPLEGIGITMANYCSQNLGALKMKRIKEGMRISDYLSIGYCIFSLIIIFVFERPLAVLFVDPSDVVILNMVYQYLNINAVFYIGLAFIFSYRNALQGIGYSSIPMFAGIIELCVRSILTFSLVGRLGYIVICWAAPLAWLCAAGFLMVCYFNKFKIVCKEIYKKYNKKQKHLHNKTKVPQQIDLMGKFQQLIVAQKEFIDLYNAANDEDRQALDKIFVKISQSDKKQR